MNLLTAVLLLAASASAAATASSRQTFLAALPANATATCIKLDAAGNIYVGGYTGGPGFFVSSGSVSSGFVGKFSPDGSQQIFLTKLSGSQGASVSAIAVDENGNVYVTGITPSGDFPVTAGAYQTILYSPNEGGSQAFAVKLDPQGAIVYSTFLGGHSPTSAVDIAVDSSGDAIVSGQSETGTAPLYSGSTEAAGFPVTPGAVDNSAYITTGYVLKLDPAGANLIFAERGLGGYLAVDEQGNIYLAGTARGPSSSGPFGESPAEPIPITPGAFQSAVNYSACSPGRYGAFGACSYQYVAKIDSTGTQLIYSTFIAGTYGATPVGIALDGQGDVIVAGQTGSADYPTTPGSLVPQFPESLGVFVGESGIYTTGYLTMLNADGSGLVFSTYLSGSSWDTVTAVAASSGSIYVAGYADSPDFPGLTGVPPQCWPQGDSVPFLSKLDYAGSLSVTQPLDLAGFDPVEIALDSGGRIFLTGDAPVVDRIDLSAPFALTCVRDAADLSFATTVVPGELISLFGNNLSPVASVTFDGLPAPILYDSPQQVNIQVPNEIAGKSLVTMTLSTKITETRALQATPINPAIFTGSDGYTLALNQDGSQNSQNNPAKPGSLITIFLTGIGVTNPPEPTGTVTETNIPLNLNLQVPWALVLYARAALGAPSGVWQITAQLPATPFQDNWVVQVAGHNAREDVQLWVSW